MYVYFNGKVTDITTDGIILETGNIGYNIIMPYTDVSRLLLGDEVRVYTYTSVREDAFLLYGFLERESLDFYKQLLTVTGVGPKAAIGILSGASIEDIKISIIAQDSKALSRLPGIGAKTAARIILDLKDKIGTADIVAASIQSGGKTEAVSGNAIIKEAADILSALGYSASEAMKVLKKLEIKETDKAEDVVSQALKLL